MRKSGFLVLGLLYLGTLLAMPFPAIHDYMRSHPQLASFVGDIVLVAWPVGLGLMFYIRPLRVGFAILLISFLVLVGITLSMGDLGGFSHGIAVVDAALCTPYLGGALACFWRVYQANTRSPLFPA